MYGKIHYFAIVTPMVLSTDQHTGIYAMLFCQCIYIYQKRPLNGRKTLLTGTIILFILCTVQFILNSAPSTVFTAAGYNTIFSVITKYESNYITSSSYLTHTWHKPGSLIADSVFVSLPQRKTSFS